MYQPLASELIQKLQEEIDEHGDVPIVGYTPDDMSYDYVTLEYNNDVPDAPVIIVSFEDE